MCGGNKGQSTQNTNQTQTYTPDAQARGYITGALDRAQNTANLPFNVPVAPVAGFSQDQLSAFNSVNNAQGMAQPYFNQAADLYRQGASGSNISNFFNPYAQAVTDNLKDIFGSQMSQTTGQLTQAAGGIGADRIAVGQSELAKQQGLAAGQTLASLYQPALQAAQSAAFNGAQGLGNVGMAAQNAALSGAQAQLGTGGLQQQLSQAQLNAPYQWQVAQAAFPYQQSQFLGSMVGALAPGLGGTTTGQSNTTSTPAQPSIWSQLLGGGAALAGGLGATGAFGSNGWLTGASQPGYGATYGGYGGSGSGFGSYGGISYPAFAKGGEVDDDPIDIAANPFIPKSQLTPIQPKIPQLQAPPQQGGGGGSTGKGAGDVIGSVAKVLPFFLARGGSVNPFAAGEGYAFGGSPTDEERELGYEMLRRGMGTRAPDTIPGGEAPPIVPAAPAEEPFRMPSEEAVQAWRDGADRDRALGLTKPVPDTVGAGPSQRPVSMDIPTETPMSYAPQDRPNTSGLPPEVISGRSKADILQNPYGPAPQSEKTLADNPWMSLLAAGLGIMGGTSPFAGVNIGQGGMQGIKALQQQKENAQKDTTIAQAARRLEQEAKFHEDQYTRMTMGQKTQAELAKLPYEKMTKWQEEQADAAERKQKLEDLKPVQIGTSIYGQPIYAKRNSKTGEYEIIEPPNSANHPPTGPQMPSGSAPQSNAPAPASPAGEKPFSVPPGSPAAEVMRAAAKREEDSGLPANATFVSDPPPPSANVGALEGLRDADAAKVRAIAEGRSPFLPTGNPKNIYNKYIMDKVYEYDPTVDATAFNRRQRTANFFSVGTQGGGGQNIAAMNTFGQHAEELLKLSEKLDLGRFKDWNAVTNYLAEKGYTKKETQDLLGQWRVAQKAVGDEGAKVFAGTNSALADREEWSKLFDPSTPKSVTREKLQQVVKLIEGRLNALTNQYNEGMRTNHEPQKLISKRTREVFEHLKKGESGESPKPAASGKPSLQDFLGKAKAANPGISDEELTAYYNKKYGG